MVLISLNSVLYETSIYKFGSKCKFHDPKDRLVNLKSIENVDGSEVVLN